MTYNAKQIVDDLRRYAKGYADPFYCGGKLINGTVMLMMQAADLIEMLSADLESDERQYGRDAFATLADEGAKLEADRDAWKRRCKAAERELGILRPCYCCKHYNKELAESGRECDPVCSENCVIASEWEWRGPCAENGGGECKTEEN